MERGVGRADYEERKERRIERLEERAEKAHKEGNSRLEDARRRADFIPFGQPILVGHHSEKRHRKDIERIRNNTLKGVELLDKSKSLQRRAATAASNHTISSDDPEALVKLRAKLASEEKLRDEGKRLNKVHKKGGWKAVADEVGEEKAAEMRRMAGYTAHDKPYPPFSFTNLGANIRRLKQRIEYLERQAKTEVPEPETYGEIEVREEDNRVQMVFPGKPDAETRKMLKSEGFRWAPSTGAWQRQASPQAWYKARALAKRLTGE